jgi:hypothetical protein
MTNRNATGHVVRWDGTWDGGLGRFDGTWIGRLNSLGSLASSSSPGRFMARWLERSMFRWFVAQILASMRPMPTERTEQPPHAEIDKNERSGPPGVRAQRPERRGRGEVASPQHTCMSEAYPGERGDMSAGVRSHGERWGRSTGGSGLGLISERWVWV